MGHKKEVIFKGHLMLLAITEATGFATAQSQQHRVSTTHVAAVPSVLVLSCVLCFVSCVLCLVS